MYACMGRISHAIDADKTDAILRNAWNELLNADCCLAGKRHSWGSFLTTSNDENLGTRLFDILHKIGCESIAFAVCRFDGDIDKTIGKLESELLDHNSYWQGIKIM